MREISKLFQTAVTHGRQELDVWQLRREPHGVPPRQTRGGLPSAESEIFVEASVDKGAEWKFREWALFVLFPEFVGCLQGAWGV